MIVPQINFDIKVSPLSHEIVDKENATLSFCGDFETRKRAEQFIIKRKRPKRHLQQKTLQDDIVLAEPESEHGELISLHY